MSRWQVTKLPKPRSRNLMAETSKGALSASTKPRLEARGAVAAAIAVRAAAVIAIVVEQGGAL